MLILLAFILQILFVQEMLILLVFILQILYIQKNYDFTSIYSTNSIYTKRLWFY